jgi:hypothetical protein
MREPSNEFISFPMFCSVILCVCLCVCGCMGVCVRVIVGGHVKGWGSYKGERQELTNSSKSSNR